MLTQMVSPPAGGHSMQRSSDAIDGVCPPGHVAVEDVLARLAGGVAAEQHELRVVGVVREHRVHLELAEAAGQGDVGGGRDRLVAEHEHLVAHQGLAQRGDGVVVELVVEVDRADLGADVRRDRGEVELGVGAERRRSR